MRADNMEREHIYFRGQADAFAYLKKIGAFKTESWIKTVRSNLHRFYILKSCRIPKSYYIKKVFTDYK